MSGLAGVSFIVPVYNGERWLEEVLKAILTQAREEPGRTVEILAVDDCSTDGSLAILRRFEAAGALRILRGEGRGAAAASNLGFRAARQPILCQVDQDVILQPGWLVRLAAVLEEPGTGAVQGYYVTPRPAGWWARAQGLDLEQRYRAIQGERIDHACTGNSAYRAEAARAVGYCDESLGYGYDNDLSYRLAAAGHRIVFCREARSVHRWRESCAAFLRQQYGLGYGRLELIRKHPRRSRGDDVSGLRMILHVPAMLLALLCGLLAGIAAASGGHAAPWTWAAAGLLGLLTVDRLVAGAAAAIAFHDPAGLFFVPAHLLRDLAWAAATLVWIWRRLWRIPPRPEHSMPRR